MKIRFAAPARLELTEAFDYYEAAQPGLGEDFLREIEVCMELIRQWPEGWTSLSAKLRRCRTKRFPFGLLYEIRSDHIAIVAVADLRRDPQRWEDLL